MQFILFAIFFILINKRNRSQIEIVGSNTVPAVFIFASLTMHNQAIVMKIRAIF